VWEKMYTFWAASSIYNHFLVSGNTSFILDLRPELEAFYESYLATHYHPQHECMYERVGGVISRHLMSRYAEPSHMCWASSC
jgi:hypothetical protein